MIRWSKARLRGSYRGAWIGFATMWSLLCLSCDDAKRHPVEGYARSQRFYYGFTYIEDPPAGAGITISTRPRCEVGEHDEEPDIFVSLSDLEEGVYEVRDSFPAEDYLNGSHRAFVHAKMREVEGRHPLVFTRVSGTVILEDVPGDGVMVAPRKLRARVNIEVPKRSFGTLVCEGEVPDDNNSPTEYRCFCQAVDGEEKMCMVSGGVKGDPESCCKQFSSPETEAIEFVIEAEYCPSMCAELVGLGLIEKWCPSRYWDPLVRG